MSISDNVPDSHPLVLIIGARGVLGALVADAFRRHGWAVRGSSRDPSRPPDFQYVDLTDPATLAPALDGVDLVVTTVPDPTLAAERHVLEHGGVLLNLSAEPATALRSLRRQAGPAKGTVVMNAGIAPGVTNLLAAELLEENPGADEVELVFTVTAQGTGGAASAAFAHRGFTGRGHHRVKQVTLPKPFGSRRVLGFAEPDGGWLGPAADGLTVSPYICLAERSLGAMMRTLNAVRLISKLPPAALGSGRRTAAAEASREPVAHLVAVLHEGLRLDYRLVVGQGDFRMAASSGAVFADALLGRDGRVTAQPGAWYPEEVISLERVEASLRRAGINVIKADHDRVDSAAAGDQPGRP
jgi:NAD(P)-dependent dehydrogenase (short-subunit alcohol dehydrogenase family)